MSRPSYLHLAATRPIVPLASGYVVVALLLGGLVSVQSGPGPALATIPVNLLMLAPSMGMAWIFGRVLEKRAAKDQSWWVTRAQGHLAGFTAAVAVAAIPLAAVMDQIVGTPEAASLSRAQVAGVLVAAVATINGAPLLLALGIEAYARRRVGIEGPVSPPPVP
ncbi:MAG: hypothetical protein ACK4YP_23800 [Myxococcota bacterium]